MAGLERIPPQNIEAEQSLLGSLLIDSEAIAKIVDGLSQEDFYRNNHSVIFEAIVQLYARHEPIDILSLGNRLDEMNKLKQVGGRAYLAELSNIVPTASHVKHYSEIIRKKATLRRLISTANEISEMGYQELTDISETIDLAEQKLFGVSQNMLKQNFVSMTDILTGAFDRIDALHKEKGKLRGTPTGFPELDSILAGLQASDLIILAARPSVGKTSFALNIAQNVGTKSKVPVAIFSLEMSKEQLVDRMICTEADVDLWKMRTGRLSEHNDDFPKIGHALGVLSEAKIFIDDQASANIMEIRAKCRRLQSEHGLGLVIVDYLQLMETYGGGSRDGNRTQEVSQMSRGLKQLARELNCPVLVLSQLNRAVELTKPAIPRLAHLRESGSIEQDADVVLFIYRKAVDPNFRGEELPPEDKTSAEIYIAKHRNGPTGMIRLYWDAQRASFKSLERRRSQFPAPAAQAAVAAPADPPPLEAIPSPSSAPDAPPPPPPLEEPSI